jgi:hypothetical protein
MNDVTAGAIVFASMVAVCSAAMTYAGIKLFLYGMLVCRHIDYQQATGSFPTNPNPSPAPTMESVIRSQSKEPVVPVEQAFNPYAETDTL